MRNGTPGKLGFVLALGLTATLLAGGVGARAASQPKATRADEASSSPDEEGGLVLPPGALPPRSSPSDPTEGTVNQALGFYSKGNLTNDSVFPLEGYGFVKILRPRKRWYGTFDMRYIVETAAAELHHDFPGGERIQIGDVAQHGGGPVGHISHENGLDADIVYLRENHVEQDPDFISSSPTGFQELFVIPPQSGQKTGSLSPNFDLRRNWEFVKHLHATGRIVRIFMDPVIKASLCQYAREIGEFDSQTEVLRRIRPLADHQDHMHVRISCPTSSPSCQAQVEPPPGDGCSDVISTPYAPQTTED